MNFQSFSGRVRAINDFFTMPNDPAAGCYKMFSVVDRQGAVVNFVVEPDTYFVDHALVNVGDRVIGFYDADAPAILIYPPQYPAIVMAKEEEGRFVKVDFFNEQLVSSDGNLRLNISDQTAIRLENGQAFTGNLGNRNLVVVYSATTRSIPAQTTPSQVIVLC